MLYNLHSKYQKILKVYVWKYNIIIKYRIMLCKKFK